MSKQDRKLDLITGIPSDLLEFCAAKRFKLLTKRRAVSGAGLVPRKQRPFSYKKVWTTAIAALLFFAVGLSLFFVFFEEGKQIPIYLGMTVSKEAPAQIERTYLTDRSQVLYDTPSSDLILLSDRSDKDCNLRSATADSSFANAALNAPIYYVDSGEDFYITVHIDNPDKFEIVSFTLNGEKYSSYMFEDGSDMENLILKCNPGDAGGIVEYTIDAIKYIDGTEIKDVRLKGERTVQVGVYTENQPTTVLSKTIVDYSSIQTTVSIRDEAELLTLTESEVYADLYQNGIRIERKPIDYATATTVRFDGLNDGEEYMVGIVADYDALDGAGKLERIICEQTLTTPTLVSVAVSDIKLSEASYRLIWDGTVQQTPVSLVLYADGKKVQDLDVAEGTLTGLQTNTTYTLTIEYQLNGQTKFRSTQFTTLIAATPTISIVDLIQTENSIEFSIRYNDPDDVGQIDRVELLLDDQVIATATGTEICFTDLEVLKTYAIEITCTFDLKDGHGMREADYYQQCVTQSRGLKITNGTVTGIGSCTDTEVYINMPIAPSAFRQNVMITSVVLGEGVTKIGSEAFKDCSYLKKVYISPGLSKIGDCAFWGCKFLERVTLPNTLKEIEYNAFTGCTSMSALTLPDSLTALGNHAFASSGLTKLVIPEGITELSDGLLHNCTQLTELTLPNTLKKIGMSALSHCSKIDYLALPEGVNYIRSYAFDYGPDVVYIPKSVTTMDEYCFTYGQTVLVGSVSKPTGWNYEWTTGQATIFWGVEGLTTDSQGITYITFRQNDRLIVLDFDDTVKTVVLPDGVIQILPEVFAYSSLENITIPGSVTVIGDSAFANCLNLQTVVLNEGLLVIGEKAFAEDQSLTEIILPNTVTTIEKEAFYRCGLKTIVLNEGLSTIGELAFSENKSLSEVRFPETLKIIDEGAFHMCDFRSIEFNEGLTMIGNSAFVANYQLSEVIFSDTITSIGSRAFETCDLKRVYIPASITIMGEYVFGDGHGLAIYCQAPQRPPNWNSDWAGPNPKIHWNATVSAKLG